MADYSIDAMTDSIVINSLTKITLQVGPNSIVIDTEGVTINGMNLSFQAQTQMQVQALMLKEQVSGVKDSTIALYKQA